MKSNKGIRKFLFMSLSVAISLFSLCYSISAPILKSFFDPVVSFYGEAYEINLEGNVINSLSCGLRQIEMDEGYLINETPVYMVCGENRTFIDTHDLCIEYKQGNDVGMSLLDFDRTAGISYGGQYRQTENVIISDNEITVTDSKYVEFINTENNHTAYYMRPEFVVKTETDDYFDALINAQKIGVKQTQHQEDAFVITNAGTVQLKNFDFYIISADEDADMCFKLNTNSKYTINIRDSLNFEGQADKTYFVTGKKSTLNLITDNNPREFSTPYMNLRFDKKETKDNKLGNSIVDVNFSHGIENADADLYLDYNCIYSCKYSSYVKDAYVNDKTLTPNPIENILYNIPAIIISFITTIVAALVNILLKSKE